MRSARTEKLILRFKNQWLTVVLFSVMVIVFACATKYFLTAQTTKMVISYINEIAENDVENVKDFVNDRWNMLDDFSDGIRKRKPSTADELFDAMQIYSASGIVDRLYLLDEAGNLYTEDRQIIPKENNEFLKYIESARKKSVVHIPHDSADGGECMLYISSVGTEPITVGQAKIVRIMVLNDVSIMRERLKTSIFEGRGCVRLIETDGEYIIGDSEGDYDSFFDMLRAGEVTGLNIETAMNQIGRGGSAEFWYCDMNGVKSFVTVIPMPDYNWSFVAEVDSSVFSEQITQFVWIVMAIVLALLLALAVVLLVFSHAHKRLQTLYAGVIVGVHNRQYYNDKLVDETVKGLAIFDLDHLKSINDAYGHLAGDMAIEQIARVLKSNALDGVEIFRFGGDEFVMLFTKYVSMDDFLAVVKKVGNDIRASRIERYPDMHMTSSGGGYYGEGVAHEILRKADMLLYEAKKTRDRIVTNLDGII